MATDKECLDWLDTLTKRTWKHRGKEWALASDVHFSGRGVSIYLRNEIGDAIFQGHGKTIRAAIDGCITEMKRARNL